jgi:hypothetical protein
VPTRDQARLAVLRQASRQARASGRAVTVAGATTPTSVTVARPNGEFATTTDVLPVRVRRDGRWVPVSATLRRTSAGFSPAATPSGLTLSAGGRGPLAVLTDPARGRLAFSMPFSLPRPSVTGATATYRGVLPGVDLVVTASDQGGFNEVLVVRSAAAAANPALRRLRLAVSARKLTVRTDPHGNLTVTAPDGKVAFSGPAPRMWDSGAPASAGARRLAAVGSPRSSILAPGPRAHAAAVGMRATAGALVLVPDWPMLSPREKEWPVFIDPSISPTSSSTAGYVETQQGCSTTKNFNSSSVTMEGVGWQDYSSSCYGLYRSFFQISTTNLNSVMDVTSATLDTQEVYGSDETCSHTWPVTLSWTAGIGASTDWSTQPAVQSILGTASPKTAWCGTQDVNFNVTSVMQTTAAHNYTQWTFGLTGDESELGFSSCSPSSEFNCGFMRFGDKPTVTTVYDLTPSVPTATTTSPAPQNGGTTTGLGCAGTSTGWIGKTDNNSGVNLDATVTSNITGEHVRAQYTLWDNSATSGAADTDVVASPDSSYVASGTPVSTPVGIALADGHQYTWTADAYDGILTSADAPVCHFDADLTAPTVPVVTSTTFPQSGSGASPPTIGTTGTFSFASTDSVPTGCVPACLASGVAAYEYSFNTPLPASGATTAAPGTAVSFAPTAWGTNILYVAAVDNAGNVSPTEQYDFYVTWNGQALASSKAGDVDGDGIPDLLATNAAGNLLLYPGGTDPAVTPTVAGTPATSPDGTGWNTFQITHRGSMTAAAAASGRTVDDLFALKGANLYLDPNNGSAPQFEAIQNVVTINKPACAVTTSNASNCTGYDATDWSDASQILVPGDVYAGAPSDTGLPDLLAIENDQLWLYKGHPGNSLATPVLLGSSGWSGMTLIAPGVVGGKLTLWARNDSTGALSSWPLTLDSNGVPELGNATAGAPVAATSGTAISGVTLTAAAYLQVVSSGPLTAGTCGTADPTACPGVYAEDASGNVWYFQGQSISGGAAPLSGTRLLVGNVDPPGESEIPQMADGRL